MAWRPSAKKKKYVSPEIEVVNLDEQPKLQFTDEDVTNKLKMTVSYKKDGKPVCTDLTLEVANEDGSGTFRGGWNEGEEPSEGTTLTATVVYNGESTVVSSTVSVQKLMEQCKHTYIGSFEYINDKTVSLKDDRAYIEFDLEETQSKFNVFQKTTKQCQN